MTDKEFAECCAGHPDHSFEMTADGEMDPILKSRLDRLDPETRERFWSLCPDFVIELRSTSDRLSTLWAKMREYLSNGAQLGWLIDPENHTVEIHRAGGGVAIRQDIESIEGEGPVAGFVLDLRRVWNPIQM